MTTTTNVEQTVINIMTKSQYDQITPSPTELYMVTDGSAGGGAVDDVEVNGTSVVSNGVASITTAGILPSQTSQSGKFLTTNGTNVSWSNVDSLPSQSGQSGKFLTTNGTAASWSEVPVELPSQSGQSGKFLTTNGTAASWSGIPTEIPTQTGNSGKFLTTNGTITSWATIPTPTYDSTNERITW